MDISSGNVFFGVTCPGTLMQDLLRNKPKQVRRITKFQTSMSARHYLDICPLPCNDLNIVHKFITSMDTLKELSVLNFEIDGSALWPAVFHHAKSLHSLAIHTPPGVHTYQKPKTWTPATVEALATGLPNLRHLEMDISVEEADFLLTESSPTATEPPKGTDKSQFLIDALAATVKRSPRLNSLLLNIPLADEASLLCDACTNHAVKPNTFPDPNTEACERLAQILLDKLDPNASRAENTESEKKDLNLKVRLARRSWSDRGQFNTSGCLIPVISRDKNGTKVTGVTAKETEVAGDAGANHQAVSRRLQWGYEYLPPWPSDYLSNLVWEWRREKGDRWYLSD